MSGKSTICKVLNEKLNFKIISMKDLSIELKKKMGTDEEPFEGEVPIANIEKEIISIIRNSESNTRFIFDDYTHKTE